jgi:hypothetical protein
MAPFAQIPPRSHPFYMSDCANPGDKLHSRPIGDGSRRLAVVETAIWNDDMTTGLVPFYDRDTIIDIYVIEASLAVTPLLHDGANPHSGLNTDLQIGLYEVPPHGPAVYQMDKTALFRTPYGKGEGYGPNSGGQVINAISTVQTAPMSYRRFSLEAPLVLQIVTPPEEGRYALGVVLTLNHAYGDDVDFHYQFHIHGAHCRAN